jgi:hypothetical protein
MRFLSYVSILGTLVACKGPMEPVQAFDGAWKLYSASPGVPPRTMTLTHLGMTITGTGSAMGVDVPIPIAITGTYSPATLVSPPLAVLIFAYGNGGGMTAQYSATLRGGDSIVGSVIYYGITNVPQTGTLSFTRQ